MSDRKFNNCHKKTLGFEKKETVFLIYAGKRHKRSHMPLSDSYIKKKIIMPECKMCCKKWFYSTF